MNEASGAKCWQPASSPSTTRRNLLKYIIYFKTAVHCNIRGSRKY
jgi:hypothetical protein